MNYKNRKAFFFWLFVLILGLSENGITQNLITNGNFEQGQGNWEVIINSSETNTNFEITGENTIAGDSSLVIHHQNQGEEGLMNVTISITADFEKDATYDLSYIARSSQKKWIAVTTDNDILSEYHYTYPADIEFGKHSFVWTASSGQANIKFMVGYDQVDFAQQSVYDFFLDEVELTKRENTITPTSLNLSNNNIELAQGEKTRICAIVEPYTALPEVNWISRDETTVKVNNGELMAISGGSTYIVAQSAFFPSFTDSALVSVIPSIAKNGDFESGDQNWIFTINSSETDSEFDVKGDEYAISGDSSLVLSHAAAGNKGMWRVKASTTIHVESGFTYDVYYKAKCSMDKWTGFRVENPAFSDTYFWTSTQTEEYGPFTFVENQENTSREISWWIGYSKDEALTQQAYDFYIDDLRVIKRPTIPPTAIEINQDNQTIGAGAEITVTATVTPSNADPLIEWISRNQEIIDVDEDGKVTAIGQGETYIVVQSKVNPGLNDSIQVEVHPNIVENGGFEEGITGWETGVNSSEPGSFFKIKGGSSAISGDSSLLFSHAAGGEKGMWRIRAAYEIDVEQGYTYHIYYKAKCSMKKWTGFNIESDIFPDAYFWTYTEPEEYGPFSFAWTKPATTQELVWWIGYTGDEAPNLPVYDFYIDDLRVVKHPTVSPDNIILDEHEITINAGDIPEFTFTTIPENADKMVTIISRDDNVVLMDDNEIEATKGGSTYVVFTSTVNQEATDSVLVNVLPDIVDNGTFDNGDENWNFSINASETDSEFDVKGGEYAISGDSSLVFTHAAAGNKGMWRVKASTTIDVESGYIYEIYYKANCSMQKWTGFRIESKAFEDQYFWTSKETTEYGPFTFVWNQENATQEISWWIGYTKDEANSLPAYDFIIDDLRVIKRPAVATTNMELSNEEITLSGGETYKLNPVLTPENGDISQFIFTSRSDSILVADDGTISGNYSASGYVIAEAQPWGLTDSILVNIAETPFSGMYFSNQYMKLKKDETDTLELNFLPHRPANDIVRWYSTNDELLSVSDGVITGIDTGEVTVVAISDMHGFLTEINVDVYLKIIAIENIKIKPNELTVEVGGALGLLEAVLIPADATIEGLVWSSEDPDIVDIDQEGRVTALANGETIVTVKTADGENSAQCNVTAITRVRGVSLNERSVTLENGKTFQLVATVIPEDASDKSVRWESSNEDVVTVDENGLVTAVGTGNAEVRVYTNDKNWNIACNFTVTPASAIQKLNYESINIYPIPAKDKIKVSSYKEMNKIYIYNSTGQLITIKNCKNTIINLTVSSYPTGIYLLKAVTCNGKILQTKFIVN